MNLVNEGDRAWTPQEPYVMVKIAGVYHSAWSGRTIAIVEFLGDYHGHRPGTTGDFYLEDLTRVDEGDQDDLD